MIFAVLDRRLIQLLIKWLFFINNICCFINSFINNLLILRFSVFQNGGGDYHLGFCWILFSDHPRCLPDDLKLCLKFYVDLIYTFEDTAISIFRNLAKNAYSGPKNGFFEGLRP